MIPPAPASSTATTERDAAAAVEPLLQNAIEKGESVVLRGRILIVSLVLLRMLAVHLRDLQAGNPKYVGIVSVLGLGLLLPAAVVAIGRRTLPVATRTALSTVVDPVLITMVLAPLAIWPHPDYRGMLREIDTAFFFLAILASALRLMVPAVISGSAASAIGLLGLVGYDHLHNRAVLDDASGELTRALILLAGSTALATLMASRARRLVYQGARATLDAERARQRLGVYISEEFAARALADKGLQLGGERREVAVLFSDLRGFTAYAESVPPERLVSELNEYLRVMVDEVRREGGVIDKYIGDAIMAVFGVLDDSDTAAARALRAAAAMDVALARHNEERTRRGRPPLAHGIGVHVGSVIAGNVGTPERMQFTVIGDVVNLASRLESASKELQASVVASMDVVQAARRGGLEAHVPGLVERGEISVRGRAQPLVVFTVPRGTAAPDASQPADASS